MSALDTDTMIKLFAKALEKNVILTFSSDFNGIMERDNVYRRLRNFRGRMREKKLDPFWSNTFRKTRRISITLQKTSVILKVFR